MTAIELPAAPRYGEASLADLVPSLLVALGSGPGPAPIAFPAIDHACVLMIDGLGQRLLERNREAAPFLASLLPEGRPLTAGFPTSTSVSVTSLGTGLPPGRHGIVGYTMAAPPFDGVLDLLGWRRYPGGRDLRRELPPERIQPNETCFGRAAAAGIEASLVTLGAHKTSGLTAAAFRGAMFRSLDRFDDTPRRVAALRAAFWGATRALVYTYDPRLDTAGHVHGIASDAWLNALREVDQVAAAVAACLPLHSLLAIVGDHGMVDVPVGTDAQLDLADEPQLRRDVRLVAGEPRMRHVYVHEGHRTEVLDRWQDRLRDRWWVVEREVAIAAGLFGPRVDPNVIPRIGDVLAIARGRVGVFQRDVAPWESGLIGHHGALDEDELLVPLLVAHVAA